MNVETTSLAEFAHTLFEESGDALFLFDPESEQMVDVNPMAQRLTGFNRSELLVYPVNYFFRAETKAALRHLRHACRKTGSFHSQEGFYLRHARDGVWVPINVTVTRLHAEQRTLGLITARDITERREAQSQLRKAEAELRQVLASVSDSLWSVSVDPTGRWISCYCSPVVEHITGWPAARYRHGLASRLEVVHHEDCAYVRSALEMLQRGERDREELEYRILRPDGTLCWVRDSILARREADQDTIRLDGILTDITERKKEESLLHARRGVLELIARGAPLEEVLTRLALAIEKQSPGQLASFHLLDDDRAYLRIAAAPSLPEGLKEAMNTLAYQAEQWTPNSRVPGPIAEVFGFTGCWRRPILAFCDAGTPSVLGALAVHSAQYLRPTRHDENLLDVAAQLAAIAVQRCRAEQSIRANEARYRSLIENLEQCIFLKDSAYRFVTVNPPFCQAAGHAETAILGKTDFDLYPAELAAKFRDDDRRVLEKGERLETEEESLIAGRRSVVRVIKTPVREAEGRIVGILGIFWDVTDQRNLEAQFRQAQKMEAIGQLAGGVAHDFNNLLTAILGNLSLLSNSLVQDSSTRELFQAAEGAAFRAAALTSQLLGFARRTLLRTEPVSLNLLVREVVTLLRRTIDPRIALEDQIAQDLWPVLADPGHLNQVLMNLCLNARDAMPGGGKLLLRTSNVCLAADSVRNKLEARSGSFVCLEVTDTGTGMDEEIRSHIFEPFFTTKGPGKGTGLGLATVFGIVKQHQGWIECVSNKGVGTTFRIFLPRFNPEADKIPEAPSSPKDVTKLQGTETILFVDDEPVLRNLGRTLLQKHGYQVLLAEDGVEALEIFQRERDSIDLVILDLTMPRLSGRDTFHALRAIDPDIPALLASGYSSEQLSSEDHAQIAGFVAKPYRPRELAALVRETMDRSPRRQRDHGAML